MEDSRLFRENVKHICSRQEKFAADAPRPSLLTTDIRDWLPEDSGWLVCPHHIALQCIHYRPVMGVLEGMAGQLLGLLSVGQPVGRSVGWPVATSCWWSAFSCNWPPRVDAAVLWTMLWKTLKMPGGFHGDAA